MLRKVQLASSRSDIGAEIKEYEDRTERQIKILSDIYEEKIAKLRQGDELQPGCDQDGQGLHRHEAQAFGRRQDGRTSR